MDEEIEVPQYFICPISLQIMKDPVTAITGITYDRESIEHWLFTNHNTTCPVTKLPLPPDSDLTPNHTLRRLIQSWCTQNAAFGIDRIPTPKPQITKFQVAKLLNNLNNLPNLTQLESLAKENERTRKLLLDAGAPKAMIAFVIRCYRKGKFEKGLEHALSILKFVKIPKEEIRSIMREENNSDQIVLHSLTWILGLNFEIDHEIEIENENENSVSIKSHAVFLLKKLVQNCDADFHALQRLNPEFFATMVKILRNGSVTQQGVNAALKVLLSTCPYGRNRVMMVEAGLVFELVEMELGAPEKRTTELTVAILFHLCSCANGRAMFLKHEGSIAVVTERIFKVSKAVDDRAVLVLALICKFSATNVVLQEMLKVGTVSKLCMLLQTDHAKYLKDKAMEILKSHSEVWKNSPCLSNPSFYATALVL